MATEKKASPNVESRLRHNILKMPQEVYQASGIVINGRRLKSFVFTTDLAIIRNCDADAVFAVYPFTPQQAISDAIIKASYIPVFCGVGGGTTHGVRTLNLARDVESQGAMGVVLNSPISDLNLLAVSRVVDIPVIITVTKENTNIQSRIDSGASILNVACSTDTPRVVAKIREQFPDVPIIASGGKTGEKQPVWDPAQGENPREYGKRAAAQTDRRTQIAPRRVHDPVEVGKDGRKGRTHRRGKPAKQRIAERFAIGGGTAKQEHADGEQNLCHAVSRRIEGAPRERRRQRCRALCQMCRPCLPAEHPLRPERPLCRRRPAEPIGQRKIGKRRIRQPFAEGGERAAQRLQHRPDASSGVSEEQTHGAEEADGGA